MDAQVPCRCAWCVLSGSGWPIPNDIAVVRLPGQPGNWKISLRQSIVQDTCPTAALQCLCLLPRPRDARKGSLLAQRGAGQACDDWVLVQRLQHLERRACAWPPAASSPKRRCHMESRQSANIKCALQLRTWQLHTVSKSMKTDTAGHTRVNPEAVSVAASWADGKWRPNAERSIR